MCFQKRSTIIANFTEKEIEVMNMKELLSHPIDQLQRNKIFWISLQSSLQNTNSDLHRAKPQNAMETDNCSTDLFALKTWLVKKNLAHLFLWF